MKLNKKSIYIIMTVLFSSLLMSYIDVFILPPYFYRSAFKVVLFLLIPLIYFVLYTDELKNMKLLFVPKKKDFLIAISLGIIVYVIILGAYFLLKDYIDFNSIQNSLTQGVGVNADNFIYVALYISFMNSLLEEFFFRGYSFILLKGKTNRLFAYIFSSVLFAFYHVGMTNGWFNGIIYVLAMLGLMIGGCIFNYLNEKCENIYMSWLVHMFANFAINTVGCILFGII